MCGIVGYAGGRPAAGVLLDALRRLEYRGYDSAGVATLDAGRLHVLKFQGKIDRLGREVLRNPPPGRAGIGHTRWATHGEPSDANAHPHTDCANRIAVVHNGIVENFAPLKARLKRKGHRFRSGTDTELIAHLLEDRYRGSLSEALREAARSLKGQFVIVAVSADEPGTVVGLRQGPPLIAGFGKGENFLSSDIPALLPNTRRIQALDDGQMAVASRDGLRILDARGREVRPGPEEIDWDVQQAQKGDYDTFMLKEIHEQPDALENTLAGRLDAPALTRELGLPARRLSAVDRVHFVACGTAWHASLVGRLWMESVAGVPATADIASEFRYADPVLTDRSLVIAVTQSGETADTLAAVRMARERGAAVLTVCNVVGSSVPRASDSVLYTRAGPEIGVASTKAYTTQLLSVMLLAIHLGRLRGSLPGRRAEGLLAQLKRSSGWVRRILEGSGSLRKTVSGLGRARNVLFIGRHVHGATALEGALKLKEISYLHAEGYFGGELKHGPLAMIEKGLPVVAVLQDGPLFPKMLSNLQEVKARGGRVIAVASEGARVHGADEVIPIPACDPLVSPLLAIVPLQLFAYRMAEARGRDIDQPRNLAKSVTVE